jgi:nitroreductase
MSIYELIQNRRTIRRFEQATIPYDILEKIVNAGRIAPSGSNLQPCEYIIVDDPQFVAQVYTQTRWAGYLPPEQGPPKEDERPTAFIIIMINRTRRETGGGHDASAAIMNMTYVALEEGIGSCWIASVDRTEVKNILQIPDHYDVDSVLALGYIGENPQMDEDEGTVKYWRDEKGILHVPKRPLKNILHRNIFK